MGRAIRYGSSLIYDQFALSVGEIEKKEKQMIAMAATTNAKNGDQGESGAL